MWEATNATLPHTLVLKNNVRSTIATSHASHLTRTGCRIKDATSGSAKILGVILNKIQMISLGPLYWVYRGRSGWSMFSEICKQFSRGLSIESPPMSPGFNCHPPTLLLDLLIAPIVPRISNDNPSQGILLRFSIISQFPGFWRGFGSAGEHAGAGGEARRRGAEQHEQH